MNRRDLLAQVATLAAMGAVAGCIGELDSPGESPGGATTDRTDTAGTEDDLAETTEDRTDTAGTEDDIVETTDGDSTTDGGSTEGLELQSREISTTDTDCGTVDDATVAFDAGAGTVRVDGSIATSDPCHVATIDRAGIAGAKLTVVVGARAADADACQQCLGRVDYAARFEFVDGLPGAVVVQHASRGETTTVASESRSVRAD